MAAAGAGRSTRSRFPSFCCLRPVFSFGTGRRLAPVFAVVCVLLSRPVAAANEADFVTEEFLKKEFSLVKPYRGEWSCQRRRGCPVPARGCELSC